MSSAPGMAMTLRQNFSCRFSKVFHCQNYGLNLPYSLHYLVTPRSHVGAPGILLRLGDGATVFRATRPLQSNRTVRVVPYVRAVALVPCHRTGLPRVDIPPNSASA